MHSSAEHWNEKSRFSQRDALLQTAYHGAICHALGKTTRNLLVNSNLQSFQYAYCHFRKRRRR